MSPRLLPLANDAVTRVLVACALTMLAGFVMNLPAPLFDERSLNGVGIWAKPLKFWISLSLHFATLALLVQLVSDRARRNFGLRGLIYLTVFVGLFENVYITLQAARGRASHYNFDTQLESLMYAGMGLSAIILVLAPVVIGIMIAARRDAAPSGLRSGAIWGLIIGPTLTLVMAGYMSMSGSHFVAAPPGVSDGGGLPIVGWSTKFADLRPAHFVALHLMQLGPLTGWLLDKTSPGTARPVAIGVVLTGAALSIALFAIALSGRAPLAFLN